MKINSILIANRGEIAVRIIQTAKKLGIMSFVIKTPKEPNAMYLKMADAVCDFTGNSEGIPEFLDIERIIETAKKYNIDAIHPGYGFLAENPYFAQRCEDEKKIFIGPSADSIYKMGNKTIARQLAAKLKIPLIEGSRGNVPTVADALKEAEKIGYPVILKAASGGGGRGMRIVTKPQDMEKLFNLASAEAEKAFNDATLFLEKYIKNPRHIEFQIIGDKHGNIVHLGERECSIQRKHQKLIEESPSSALNGELRYLMGKEAVKLAKEVKYYSAGTVEFLLDEEKNFYFMEMNTRIQVEHPVTEEITGLDLIEQQIRIAQDKELDFKQKDIKLKGWAIEYRINAEDVQSNFAPYLGTIEKIIFPKGRNIRIDNGIEDGSVITPYFDSMIAKLIITGETREKAIANSVAAIKKFRIKGIKTTIPFCKAVIYNRDFRNGNINTSFIEKQLKKPYYEDPDEKMLAAYFATKDFISNEKLEEETFIDFNRGKVLSPWLMSTRLRN
ncbi:MAG: ATP-grasp domain-containing protein [Bacteroidia bacterium]|nr:ATP-grasp domain-containing protein [Bacteroidia bacterium]